MVLGTGEAFVKTCNNIEKNLVAVRLPDFLLQLHYGIVSVY